jgi:hypothetical protein
MPDCLLDYAGNLARDKHFGVLQKFVNYGQNIFITLAAGANLIKLIKTVIDRFL